MFTRAITRKPCKALIDGISTAQFCDGTQNWKQTKDIQIPVLWKTLL